MKKLITSVATMFMLCTLIFAQSPKGMKYQAVVRDAAGAVLANKSVSIRISIISGDDTGPTEFIEVHQCNTNDFGLVVCTIGKGTPVYGFFNDVVWESEKHFMGVEIDPDGGSNYTLIGVSEMASVPYAMHAETVTHNDDADADPSNEIQDLKMVGNSIRITGNTNPTYIDLTPYVNTDNQQMSFDNVTNVLTIDGGNNVDLSDLKDNDGDPTNEIQNLFKYGNNITLTRGGGTVSVDDSDSDPTNELQTISQVGNVVSLSHGGGSINVSDGDDTPFNEIQDLMFSNNYMIITNNPNATVIDLNPLMDNTDQQQLNFDDVTYKLALDNGGLVDLSVLKDDADADTTNEIQTVTQVGNDVTLSHGGGTFTVADNDDDATNELQTLSQNGLTVTLSNGGGSFNVADNDNNPGNEIQDLYMQNDSLIITGNMNATVIDLTHFIDDDGNPMNEIQDLYLQGDSLVLTNNPFATIIDMSVYKDNTDAQDMSLSGNSLELTGDLTPVDLSPYMDNTDEQDMSLSGNSLELTGDLTPVDLSPYIDNTDEQDMSLSGNSLELTGDLTPVDLSSYMDNTDEQDMTLTGNSLELTGDLTPVDLSSYMDNTDEQDMTLTGNSLELTGDVTPVDLSIYLDNTDAQSISMSNDTISISNGGFVVLPVDQVNDADADATNELQTISLTGDTLALSNGGGTIDLASYMDNTDEQDMTLTGNSLELTGDLTPVDLSSYMDNTDAQTLSLVGDTLKISGGNNITLNSSYIGIGSVAGGSLTGTYPNPTIATNAIVSGMIQDFNITTIKIATGAITSSKIGTSAVDNSSMADDAIGTVELINSAVTTAKIADFNVTSVKIATGAVTSTKLGSNAVGNSHMADDAIGTAELINSAVTTVKIADGNITSAKLTSNLTLSGTTVVSDLNPSGNVMLTDDTKAVYFGDSGTDGSWRFIRSGNDMNFERRESGVWVTKVVMNP